SQCRFEVGRLAAAHPQARPGGAARAGGRGAGPLVAEVAGGPARGAAAAPALGAGEAGRAGAVRRVGRLGQPAEAGAAGTRRGGRATAPDGAARPRPGSVVLLVLLLFFFLVLDDAGFGIGDGDLGGGPEAHPLPGVRAREQLAQQPVVQAVARLVAGELADDAVAGEVQVADGVEDLVLHELVAVAQALLVQHAGVVQHDGIVQRAAQRQVVPAQRL